MPKLFEVTEENLIDLYQEIRKSDLEHELIAHRMILLLKSYIGVNVQMKINVPPDKKLEKLQSSSTEDIKPSLGQGLKNVAKKEETELKAFESSNKENIEETKSKKNSKLADVRQVIEKKYKLANGKEISRNYNVKPDSKLLKKSEKTRESKSLNYYCKDCDYTTNLKGNLRTHIMQTHMKNRYFCKLCDFESGAMARMYRHVKLHHQSDLDIFKSYCQKCDYKTEDLFEFRKHTDEKHLFYVKGKEKKNGQFINRMAGIIYQK